MAVFTALFLICLTGALGLAAAINFFLQTGFSRAFGYGLIAIAVFMLFAVSGLWEHSSRHDWGRLAPMFALMLCAAFVSIKFGRSIWSWWLKRKRGS